MSRREGVSSVKLSELVAALEPQSPEVDCYFRLRRVNRLLEALVTENFTGLGVRPAYYTVLHALSGGKTLSPTELRAHVLRGRSNMTTLLDRMERDGLLVREADPHDRRRYCMRLTERGEALIAQAQPQHMEWLHETMAVLPPEDVEQLQALLERLWEGLERRAAAQGRPLEMAAQDDEDGDADG